MLEQKIASGMSVYVDTAHATQSSFCVSTACLLVEMIGLVCEQRRLVIANMSASSRLPQVQQFHGKYQYLFIESICNDPKVSVSECRCGLVVERQPRVPVLRKRR